MSNTKEKLNIKELSHCLSQDIKHYLIHEEDSNLESFVDVLDEISTHEIISDNDKFKLTGVMIYLALNGFNQFSEDTKTLLEKINEIK